MEDWLYKTVDVSWMTYEVWMSYRRFDLELQIPNSLEHHIAVL